MERRTFLTLIAAGGLGAVLISGKKVPINVVLPTKESGHRLHIKSDFRPIKASSCKVAVVGGGISGLVAAHTLKSNGEADFLLFELEGLPGGNSSYLSHNGLKAPFGAHYLPVPNQDAKELLEFLASIDVITGRDASGPIYSDRFLCHDKEERLYIHGQWQDGLIPKAAKGFDEFQTLFNKLKENSDHNFTIPSRGVIPTGPSLELDKISFKSFLDTNNLGDPELQWYLDYCTRDDFGSSLPQISAYAGIHYFAARAPWLSEEQGSHTLVWPEGNGFLVDALVGPIRDNIKTYSLVREIRNVSSGVEIIVENILSGTLETYSAEKVICSSPQFISPYIIPESSDKRLNAARSLSYPPWFVANLEIEATQEDIGELAWDNVFFRGPSLGYVHAGHQLLKRTGDRTIITYYRPLSEYDPVEARRALFSSDPQVWVDEMFNILKAAHPQIEAWTKSISVALWAHAMVSPSVGLYSSGNLPLLREPIGNIHFAHSDLSGMSMFEEAHYWGHKAALTVLDKIQ